MLSEGQQWLQKLRNYLMGFFSLWTSQSGSAGYWWIQWAQTD